VAQRGRNCLGYYKDQPGCWWKWGYQDVNHPTPIDIQSVCEINFISFFYFLYKSTSRNHRRDSPSSKKKNRKEEESLPQ
jgi:hypothetical protein